jgi:alkaline phosphatase D
MAKEDLDFVVHLGDYVYEERNTRTLDDYRRLHALYKTAPELREAHASFPFVAVLDDHEVDNDWAGEEPHDPASDAAEDPSQSATAPFPPSLKKSPRPMPRPMRPSRLPARVTSPPSGVARNLRAAARV